MPLYQASATNDELMHILWDGASVDFAVEAKGFLAVPPTASLSSREPLSKGQLPIDPETGEAGSVIRFASAVYFVIGTGTLPSPADDDWNKLFVAAAKKPLSAAVLATVRKGVANAIGHDTRSQGIGSENKNTLADFSVAGDDVPGLLIILNAQAALRSITGTAQQKFAGVLLAELREAAADLGYGAAARNQLSVSVVALADPVTARATAQAYLTTNVAVWGDAQIESARSADALGTQGAVSK